jgi:hypothetical protein
MKVSMGMDVAPSPNPPDIHGYPCDHTLCTINIIILSITTTFQKHFNSISAAFLQHFYSISVAIHKHFCNNNINNI